ncbi:TadE/TadG family type IV pilus assembly protein [Nocardioides sp. DS6]|uniref:TadE/TadG family type IV pilus assembly protein n=1 Tax=Nocardioides eburneus TaxID=3231482 RepID=A0ABV3T071_9ACTN
MRRRDEAGTSSLELVIVAPFLLALLMLIFVFARYAQAENLVDQSSRDAARAATAQNVRADVPKIAGDVVADAMRDAPSSCRDSARVTSITMTSGAFGLPDPNDPTAIDSVSVTVACTLDLSDLTALPMKSVTIKRTFTSPLDRYRPYR